MAVRESNAFHLEVIEPSEIEAVPIEVDVYDGANPATKLATLDGAHHVGFQPVLSATGSWWFRIARSDPKATAAILREGNIVRFRIGGVDRFAGWIDAPPKVVVISAREAAGEEYTVAGKGGLAYLGRAAVYPTGWPSPTSPDVVYTDASRGAILVDQLTAATARGVLPAISWDFDATVDSLGAPWDDTQTISVRAGSSLAGLIAQLVALGLELEMTPALVLRAYRELGRHFESTVIIRQGIHIAAESLDYAGSSPGRPTRLLVEGDGGKIMEVADLALEADPYIGRRESGISVPGTADPTTLFNAGQAALAMLDADTEAIAIPVTHGSAAGDYEPFVDYTVGDWITIDVPGTWDLAPHRIVAMTIEHTDDQTDYGVDLDLNSRSVELSIRLKRMIDALGGSSVSGDVAALSGGLPRASSDGRVAATLGDDPGYLLDKLAAGSGLSKVLIGTPGAQQVELTAEVTQAELDALAAAMMTNPMTAEGDLIVGGVAGAPGRLGRGTAGQTLRVNPSTLVLEWVDPSTGTPSGTVVSETAFGQSSAAGSASAYSRGDHTHGSPTNPITAHEAAGDPHLAYALDTDLSTHAAAADPHTGYQKESEKGAASGYAGLGAGGLVPMAQLASGTPDGTKYVRDDGTLVTPAGGSGTITVEDEGSPLSTSADTLDFVGAGVTASGTGTTKTITIPGAGGGGGGDSSFYLDTITLHGTYGDDFSAATLDGKWTLQGFEANSKLVPEANLGLRFSDFRDGLARSIWQTFTNKDEAEIIAAFTMDTYGIEEAWGPFIVDSSGTGIGVGLDPASAIFGVTGLTTYYSASLATIRAVRASVWDLGALLWVSLYKRSDVYQARFSLDGTRWSQLWWTTSAFTPAKIGFGRFHGSGNGPQEELVFLRRFNVVGDFNLGNNLVITPTSGTATYSASSEYGGGGYEANKAADANYGTSWAAATAHTDNPAYWRCAWSVGQTLNRVRLWGRDTAMRHGYLDLYDGATHVYVPFPNQMVENGRVWVDFPTLTGITQLNVCSGGGSAGAAGFMEVEAYLAS